MIFISDLDHTLINDKGKLSEFSKSEINRLIEDGILFTIASARSYSSIVQLLKGVNISLPIVEFNGAYVTDFASGEHLVVNSINKDLVSLIIEEIRIHNFEPFLSTHNGFEDKLYYELTINEGMDYYVSNRIQFNDKRLEKVEKLLSRSIESTVCVTVIGDLTRLEELKKVLSEKYQNVMEFVLMENTYSKGWYWLTIYDFHSTKDRAISQVLKMTNNTEKSLFVFGDNYNDLNMFKLTENTVAVSNAVPELKEKAKYIIGSNNEDSVVKFIKESLIAKN